MIILKIYELIQFVHDILRRWCVHLVDIAYGHRREWHVPDGIVVRLHRCNGGRRLKTIPHQAHQHNGEHGAQHAGNAPERQADQLSQPTLTAVCGAQLLDVLHHVLHAVQRGRLAEGHRGLRQRLHEMVVLDDGAHVVQIHAMMMGIVPVAILLMA